MPHLFCPMSFIPNIKHITEQRQSLYVEFLYKKPRIGWDRTRKEQALPVPGLEPGFINTTVQCVGEKAPRKPKVDFSFKERPQRGPSLKSS